MNVGSSEIAFPRHTTSQDKAAKPPKAFLSFQKLGTTNSILFGNGLKNPDPERHEKRLPPTATIVSDFKIKRTKNEILLFSHHFYHKGHRHRI